MTNLPVITLADVHCYLTLAGNWRAYIRGFPSGHMYRQIDTSVWGHSKQDAIAKLTIVLAEKNWPFDFGDSREWAR